VHGASSTTLYAVFQTPAGSEWSGIPPVSQDLTSIPLELNRDAAEDRASYAELRSPDADTGAVPNLIDGVGNVEHIQPRLHGWTDALRDRKVQRSVGRQFLPIRDSRGTRA